MKYLSTVTLSLLISASCLAEVPKPKLQTAPVTKSNTQKFGQVIEFSHTRNGAKQDAFDQAVKETDIVVVDFYSNACGPCKQLSPRIHELATEMPHIKFMKVDVDKHKDIANKFGIRSIPQLFFFKNGELKTDATLRGSKTKDFIKAAISKLG